MAHDASSSAGTDGHHIAHNDSSSGDASHHYSSAHIKAGMETLKKVSGHLHGLTKEEIRYAASKLGEEFVHRGHSHLGHITEEERRRLNLAFMQSHLSESARTRVMRALLELTKQ